MDPDRARRRLRRPLRIVTALTLVLGAAAVVPGTGSALADSTFESTDGDMKVDTSGKDWLSPTSALVVANKTDGTQSSSDDSYKGGAKHDAVCPESNTGSIPPNKDDLTELYVSHETVNGDIFLYLGWERFLDKESSASAHMGFEFNQSTTACAAATKSANIQRTAGDLLLIYDLEGGGTPVLTLMRWLTSLGANDACTAAAGAPCWGNPVDLSAAGYADGSINTSALSGASEDLTPGTPIGFSRQFGEAAINLSDAGVFPPNQCLALGRALLGSRSSGNSFVSTMKDFVGPLPISISNCGSLKIVKTDTANNVLAGAKFSVYRDDGDNVFDPVPAPGGDTLVGSCETTADGTGNCTFNNLLIGDVFWVQETDPPPGYTLPATTVQGKTIADTTVHTVTFQDALALGNLTVTKRDDAGNLLNNVTFTLKGTSTGGESVDLSCVTGVSNSSGGVVPGAGTCSFLDVPVGTYTLDETPPAAYAKDASFPKSVTITNGQTSTATATNPRLHRVVVLVCHEGTNSLHSVNVEKGATSLASIGSVPAALTAKGVTEADLCGIGGASFGGLGHVDVATTAKIGTH